MPGTWVGFWNANQPLEKVGRERLAWKSKTSGGASGVILTLEEPRAGLLEIETLERRVECEIDSVGLEPTVWECGDLRKKIEIYRLPNRLHSCEFSFGLPLNEWHEGDNAIYIRMTRKTGTWPGRIRCTFSGQDHFPTSGTMGKVTGR